MNKDYGQDLTLEVPIFIDNDLQVDDHGVLNLSCTLYLDLDDGPQTFKVPFYSMTDAIVEFHTEEKDYNQLYAIANELTKESERIREVADQIESSTANVADLFNTAYVPPT
jgi:hypothetical protein|tara:strand:- start:654 stop:986 length:333 start_codon:yes stop_codon:yes gene_type:complete